MSSKRHTLIILFSWLLLLAGMLACSGGGGEDDDAQGEPTATPTATPAGNSSPTPTPNQALGRVWTTAEILAEPIAGGAGGQARCGGEFGFRRCICAPDVPGYVRYRPAVAECNGNAAAILGGRLLEAFSIVVRDSQNRDRWPAAGSGFGGCSASVANSSNPPNACSAFKVQDKFLIGGGTQQVHCFGASGYSDLFADVVRMTVKITDDPNSSDDEIERYCLFSGREPLN